MKYSVKFLGACFFSTQVNSFYVSNFTFYAIIYLTNCRDEITQQMHLQGSPGSQSACLQVCLLLETFLVRNCFLMLSIIVKSVSTWCLFNWNWRVDWHAYTLNWLTFECYCSHIQNCTFVFGCVVLCRVPVCMFLLFYAW